MSFQAAISGLKAAENDLNVIGNNVANSATTGFKRSRTEFQDVFAVASVGGATNPTGSGVNTARIAQQFDQGNITNTNSSLDLAVSGQGFFILDNNGVREYTRDGALSIDKNGYIVNAKGSKLQTFGADSIGNITGALGPLQISQADNPPSATTAVTIGANFDANAKPPTVSTFDPLDSNSYNDTTALNVFDSQGGSHLLQMYFVRGAAPNTWQMYNYADGVAVGGANTLTFDGVGALATPAGDKITLPAFTPAVGVNPMNITTTLSGSTMFGASFGVHQLNQDGFTTGRMAGMSIDSLGIITTRFTNGQTAVQGQVALANFPNPQGLTPAGGSAWHESYAAGVVLVGKPSTASLGLLQGGALEDSNVELSQELVNLIVAQRNFQANTEVIKTSDAITQSVMNIR